MSVLLPKNIQIALATTYASAIALSAITNASPAVATATAHGLSDGALGLVTSGWARLNERIVRVDNSLTNTFDLEGIDASSTTLYPAGAGVGTFTPITAWTPITQVLEVTTNGGDQNFVNYEFMEDDQQVQIPDRIAAMSLALRLADDPTLAGYIALKAAHEVTGVRAVRITLPNGSKLFYNGYVSFNETPTMTKGQVMAVRAQISLNSRPVRYAS